LLLAAQIGNRWPSSHSSASRPLTSVDSDPTGHRPVATANVTTHIHRWIMVALAFAIFFTGGYTTWKVVSGYREHRDALATFGRDIHRDAAAHHWRYEVVSAKDEGLLLYLQKTNYIEPDRAVAEWNAGNLDALVTSIEKVPDLITQLRGATVSQLKADERSKEKKTGYVLITR
jgi:hypothetical protein